MYTVPIPIASEARRRSLVLRWLVEVIAAHPQHKLEDRCVLSLFEIVRVSHELLPFSALTISRLPYRFTFLVICTHSILYELSELRTFRSPLYKKVAEVYGQAYANRSFTHFRG